MNECIPKYEPGDDLTGFVTQSGGVTGKRCLAMSADKLGVEAVSDDTSGGNIQVAYPAAGGPVIGVSGLDVAQNRRIKVVRGPGKVVPITCSANIAFNVLVKAAADGTVLTWTTGTVPVGRTIRAATNGQDALIELAGVMPAVA